MNSAAGRDGEALAAARWRAAEDRLYPMAVSDPEGYRRALEALRVLVEELRGTAGTVDELLSAEPGLAAALPAAAGLPVELLVQAACAVRGREIVATREADRRTAVVTVARAEGRAWAVLEGPERIEEMVGGRAVATHLPSGRTLVAVLDPYSPEPFGLHEFGANGEPSRDRAFTDRVAWLAERDRWRAEIESP